MDKVFLLSITGDADRLPSQIVTPHKTLEGAQTAAQAFDDNATENSHVLVWTRTGPGVWFAFNTAEEMDFSITWTDVGE